MTIFKYFSTDLNILGCAFLTYAHKQSASRAIHTLHDKVKLHNVRMHL
jgi:hypothetical protein